MGEIVPWPETMQSRDLDMLHPLMRRAVDAVIKDLVAIDNPLRVYEGWRSPKRQKDLLLDPRKVTHAGPWESSHQYGLAVDFAKLKGKTWSWQVEQRHWSRLRVVAEQHGLVVPSPAWDPGHVEHPLFVDIEEAVRRFQLS